MKKQFLKLVMVLFGLFAGVNTVWGQDLGDVDLSDPSSWFYVNLEAKVSTSACAPDSIPGQVNLNYTNTQRQPDNPWVTDAKPVNPHKTPSEIEQDLNGKWQDGFYAGSAAAEDPGNAEMPVYPTEEDVEEWSEDQIEAASAGYAAGWNWVKAGKDYENYPQSPYTLQADLKNRWDEGFTNGLNAAKNGEQKQIPSTDGLDPDQAQALTGGYNTAYDWYKAGRYLNTASPTAWGASANLNGYALFHMEGVDSVMNMLSSYAYFEAKVKENNGWYFTGWSFTEGESDLGGAVDMDTPEDKGKLFKIYPADDPGWSNKSQEYVYATFQPVMVANYSVNGTIDVTPGAGNGGNNTVAFDVQGDRVSANDFTAKVASATTGGYSGHGTCTASHALVNGQIVVTVTYTASDATSGIYRANVTLASKSGCSSLTAPMYVRVANTSDKEASLYNGKAEPANFAEAGDLNTLIGKATAEQTVALNKDYASAVSISKDVTFDLNGYNLNNNLVVSGGNVVLAFNKLGGKITNTVTVQSGATLTLDGGTIVVENMTAIDVKSGGALIQKGANIRATSTGANDVVGVIASGTVTLKDGNIDVQASGKDATAVQVGATGKLIADGGVVNASAAVNACGVNVTGTAGEATINGGAFNVTSASAKAVALATSGKMTVEKFAVVAAHTENEGTIAYALESRGSANLTVNGGYFAATHMDEEEVVEHAPISAAAYSKFVFNAGYIKSDKVFINEGIAEPKLYNITYKGKDYNDGYRYLAVREGLNAKEYGMQAARIGTTGYTSITDALDYANNNRNKDVIIILQNDDEIPAGYYTLPSKATLIIPMKNEQETGNTIVPRIASTRGAEQYVQPTAFVTLTIANGANIDVHGTIEVSGTQRSSDESYSSLPYGPCGFVDMKEGSRMTMQGGSVLRAWGFIFGKGETDVRRNATVCEQFQMGDWKGGTTSFDMLSDSRRVFPLTHYYIQNIEAPFKYHPGAVLSTTTAVSATFGGIAVTASANDIKVVGVSGRDEAMFLMDNEADADNTWVRKWYDVENDLQVYDVNNSAHIGSMVLDLGKLGTTPLQMNSGYFVLPITCNMKIHLLSGLMDFTQNTALLPGAEVEVDKEATVTIVKNSNSDVLSGSLYIYDADQWDKYAYDEADNGGIKYTKPVMFSAGFGGQPTARAAQYNDKTKLKDASINVHGSFAINDDDCFLYTSGGGANIFSSNEDAGTFVFNKRGPTESNIEQVWQVKNRGNYTNNGDVDGDEIGDGDYFTAAQLKNKDGHEPAFTQTKGYDTNASLCYMDDEWRYRMYFDCYSADADMDVYAEEAAKKAQRDIYGMDVDYELGAAVTHIYIKPQEWVEIIGYATIEFDWSDTPDPDEDPYHPYLVGVEGNEDHTFSDAAGAGRLFILMDQDCQWWEVEKKDNLYHCIHPNNDTYYYWDEDRIIDDDNIPGWVEKHYTITWKNWDGEVLKTIGKNAAGESVEMESYQVTYGTMAEFLGTNPTRPANIDYTYDFTGWSPALGPVTQDVTYTATYAEQPRKYTIVFCQEGGVEIDRQFLTHNEMPVKPALTKPGHTLQWSPEVKAVTGDATYTATWLENPPTEYEVTFFDYDGTTVLQQDDVEVGEMPAYTGETPTGKAAWAEDEDNKEFTYVFDHWSPALEEVSATSIKSYTAVYAEVAKTYTIKFVKENGDPDTPADVIESHQYQYGETPVCMNPPIQPEDADLAQYTYTLRWTPQIQTVMGDAVYEATFDETLNKYTVNVKSNPSGACIIYGNGLYDYNDDEEAVAIAIAPNEDYTFIGWSDASLDEETFEDDGYYVLLLPITADINLIANFTYGGEDKVTIQWKNENGADLKTVEQQIGTATIYTGDIPTKAADAQYTYTFDGWTTSPNGAGSFYKNNQTPKATANATYYAHFAAKEEILEIGIGQAQSITEPKTVNQLIIHSDGIVSGQLTGNIDDLEVKGACYYDLTGTFTAGKWFAVAVPWQVSAGSIMADGKSLSWNNGNYLAYYDGSVRAAQGKVDECWQYVSNSNVLIPGRLYMLYLQKNASKLRFPKIADAPILNSTTDVETYPIVETKDANWNGIANPAVFNAYLSNTGATVGQVFNADKQSYEPVSLSSKLIVAKPIFVQATTSGSAKAVITPPSSAPARRNEAAETQKAEYQVEIAAYGKMQDRLFIRMNDEKEADSYTLGQDLVKFGISNTVAQMWVNRYDAKLCLNTMAPVNSVAEFPISIFAPKTGEYTITNSQSPITNEDYTLYLTFNGEVIWNLTESAYTANLKEGTDANYGLRISAKAPQTATGIDEAIIDSKDASAAKVLIGNQVFIIRGNKVYTIDGKLVK